MYSFEYVQFSFKEDENYYYYNKIPQLFTEEQHKEDQNTRYDQPIPPINLDAENIFKKQFETFRSSLTEEEIDTQKKQEDPMLPHSFGDFNTNSAQQRITITKNKNLFQNYEELVKQLEEKNENLEDTNKQLNDKLLKVNRLTLQVEELENTNANLQEQLQEAKKVIVDLQQINIKQDIAQQSEQTLVDNNKKTVQKYEKLIELQKQQIKEIEELNCKLKIENEQKQEKIKLIQKKQLQLKERLSNDDHFRIKNQKLREQNKKLLTIIEEEQDEKSKQFQQLKNLRGIIDKKDQQIETLMKKCEENNYLQQQNELNQNKIKILEENQKSCQENLDKLDQFKKQNEFLLERNNILEQDHRVFFKLKQKNVEHIEKISSLEEQLQYANQEKSMQQIKSQKQLNLFEKNKKLLENEISSLKKEYQQLKIKLAEQYEEERDQFLNENQNLLQKQILKKEQIIQQQNKKIQAHEIQIKTLQQTLDENEDQNFNDYFQEISDRYQKIIKEQNQTISELKHQLKNSQKTYIKNFELENLSNNQNQTSLQAEIESLKKENKELQKYLQSYKNNTKELEQKVALVIKKYDELKNNKQLNQDSKSRIDESDVFYENRMLQVENKKLNQLLFEKMKELQILKQSLNKVQIIFNTVEIFIQQIYKFHIHSYLQNSQFFYNERSIL